MKLFTQPGCTHCKDVVIPEDINVEIVVCDHTYDGLTPDSYPLLLMENDLKLNGSHFINKFLQSIKHAQDGFYKK